MNDSTLLFIIYNLSVPIGSPTRHVTTIEPMGCGDKILETKQNNFAVEVATDFWKEQPKAEKNRPRGWRNETLRQSLFLSFA